MNPATPTPSQGSTDTVDRDWQHAWGDWVATIHLLQASPRLYDALKLLVDRTRDGHTIRPTSPQMRIACEALLAARGERP